jgi:hypothetical protein
MTYILEGPWRDATPQQLLEAACILALRDPESARVFAFYAVVRSIPHRSAKTYNAASALLAVLNQRRTR